MSNNWNKEAIVVFSGENDILIKDDFNITEDPRSPELYKYLVEALHSVYGRIIFGETVYPWVYIKSEDLILTPSDIRDKWQEWYGYVRTHGAYGWGL